MALVLALGAPAVATASSSAHGTDFLVAFLVNSPENGEVPVAELHLTADAEVRVLVEHPAGVPTFTREVVVAPGQDAVVTLPDAVMLGWTAGAVMDNAVRASASTAFGVHAVNRAHESSDAALVAPIASLGTEHYLLGPPPGSWRSAFAVVATRDETTVVVEPTARLAGLPDEPSSTLRLDAGDAWLGAGSGDLSGTRITSDEPIAVFEGVDCAFVPALVGYCDHLFESSPPVRTWGRTFPLAAVPDRPGGVLQAVVAAHDDTRVSLDGVEIASLDRGGVHRFGPLEGDHLLVTSRPTRLVQFVTGGASAGATIGDPAMWNVTPLDQFGTRHRFASLGGSQFFDHRFLVVVEAADVGVLTVNGAAIPSSEYRAIPGSPFHVASVASEGEVATVSEHPHATAVLGYAPWDSYFAPGGVELRDLRCGKVEQHLGTVVACPEEVVELSAAGLALPGCLEAPTYEWRNEHGVVGDEELLLVPAGETGAFTVTASCPSQPDCRVTDFAVVEGAAPPDGVGATLRVSRSGDAAVVGWDLARGLLPGETYRLLEAEGGPTADFELVNGTEDVGREFVQARPASRLFLDLRVANRCGDLSADEFPPTHVLPTP